MNVSFGPSMAALAAREALIHETAHADDRQAMAPAAQQESAAMKLDSLSEMGEMESLRLQMAMDRLSKMMSTVSNLMHKISETQDAIVQNMK